MADSEQKTQEEQAQAVGQESQPVASETKSDLSTSEVKPSLVGDTNDQQGDDNSQKPADGPTISLTIKTARDKETIQVNENASIAEVLIISLIWTKS